MTAVDWLLDVCVAAAGPFVAITVTLSGELPRAVVLFLAFGFLSALAWTRLDAIDVALVEASIGAGLNGALLITAIRWADGSRRRPPMPLLDVGRLVLMLGIALGVGAVVLALPDRSAGLAGEVRANLGLAGVAQPVTAVLINYRGYDTLIEILVLVVAAVAIGTARGARSDKVACSELLGALADTVLPACIVLSGYFLWRGAHGPGGAFQAGAVLAGGAVVSMLGGRMRSLRSTIWWMRALLTLGPASFLVIAVRRLAAGASLLEYAPGWAGAAIFAIELASLITIALVLASFFPGVGALERDVRPDGERGHA